MQPFGGQDTRALTLRTVLSVSLCMGRESRMYLALPAMNCVAKFV